MSVPTSRLGSASSLHVFYDEAAVPKIAAEIREGTIHETTLRLFVLWLGEKEENLDLAAEHIRELKLSQVKRRAAVYQITRSTARNTELPTQDYPTSRIKNLHLRALLDATKDIRESYTHPPAAVDEEETAKRSSRMTFGQALRADMDSSPPKPRQRPAPISTPSRMVESPLIRTPTSSKLQARSPFSYISPAFRSLRKKAESVRGENKLSIGKLPKTQYPPDVPDRPMPLNSPSIFHFTRPQRNVEESPTPKMHRTEDPFTMGKSLRRRSTDAEGSAWSDADTLNMQSSPDRPTHSHTNSQGTNQPQQSQNLPPSDNSPLAFRRPRRQRLPLPEFTFPNNKATTVDMERLDPFEASWRRINSHLLVSAFGRDDAVLSEAEISFIEDMAIAERLSATDTT